MDKQTLRLGFIPGLVLLVFWTGTSTTALWVASFFFVWRGLALTLSYHRYFSHRSFKTSRIFQFFLALAGSICMQRGALWWAANHRKHHQYSDLPEDPHSPVAHGFWHGHMGWAMELDFGWWVLIGLQRLGIVWDVKAPDQETIKALGVNPR